MRQSFLPRPQVLRPARASGKACRREMLERNFREIPDLHFNVHILICEPPHVASRLRFDCTPKGRFLGLDVSGRKVSFTENELYRFGGRKIAAVWSVIDKAAIEAQLLFCGVSPSQPE